MKPSSGLKAVGPTSLVIALLTLGAGLQAVATRSEQMSITTIVDLGQRAAFTRFLSVVLLEESSSLAKIVGVAPILSETLRLRF